MQPEALLRGWTILEPAAAIAPVAAAAAALTQLGAERHPEPWDPHELRLVRSGTVTSASLAGWTSERALATRLDELGEPELTPSGAVLTAYSAARLAGAALAGGRRRLAVADLVEELLVARPVRGRIRPELLRCADGWVTARFRDDGERELLEALVGPVADASIDTVVSEARVAQLLVAPIRPPRRRAASPWWTDATADGGSAAPSGDSARVVDWTVLWAGPWATEELRRGGAEVLRVEHPRRRDGLLRSEPGAAWWEQLNGRKTLELLDAREPEERRRLEESLARADVLVTSMTPRALASLGFTDEWREAHAPGLLHVELVAFEDPWADLPGLGELPAAEAGLLWRAGETPARPYSWPDPLLGASALLLTRAWLASSRRRGGRVRISLERAAALAFAGVRLPEPTAAAAR